MTFAEKLEARGEARGENQKANKIAINMLKNGSELAFIANVTELSLAEIEKLRNALK